jgi:hypothetical protein
MPVVWHDAKGEKPGRNAVERLSEHFLERAKIAGIEENAYTADRAVKHMKNETVSLVEGAPRHYGSPPR